ncbi:MAG: DinB family protein [Planctomycetota bacterium]
MSLAEYIQTIQLHLIGTFGRLLDWCDRPEPLKRFRPADGGWTALEVLEHVVLTNHFLLILIDKGAAKALRNVRGLVVEDELARADLSLDAFESIGVHRAFPWERIEHADPGGRMTEHEIRARLIDQLTRCLAHLARLDGGQGLLHRTTMSVQGLGKITVYEYVYFLSQHARRHAGQLDANAREFEG